MRAITSGDIGMLARHLARFRPEERQAVALRLLDRAHAADRFRRRMGRAHRLWGDGSLAAALPPAEIARARPVIMDRQHLEAMHDALRAILCWKDRSASRQGFP